MRDAKKINYLPNLSNLSIIGKLNLNFIFINLTDLLVSMQLMAALLNMAGLS